MNRTSRIWLSVFAVIAWLSLSSLTLFLSGSFTKITDETPGPCAGKLNYLKPPECNDRNRTLGEIYESEVSTYTYHTEFNPVNAINLTLIPLLLASLCTALYFLWSKQEAIQGD